MEQTTDMTVRKSVLVRRPPELAFRVFTEQIATWWPFQGHSVGDDQAETLVMEPGVGGRLYERLRDGREVDWGRIELWEPPRRVAFTWHPGRGAETAQAVDVRFVADRDGTRVELEHRGWERVGEGAREKFESYDTGWEEVLRRFVRTASETH